MHKSMAKLISEIYLEKDNLRLVSLNKILMEL